MRCGRATLVAAVVAVAVACDAGPGGPVKVAVTRKGFEPWRVQARKDVPLTLIVTRTTDETCATELVLPEYGIDQPLPLGQPVTITFTPRNTGELRYGCAMKMFQGVVEVR